VTKMGREEQTVAKGCQRCVHRPSLPVNRVGDLAAASWYDGYLWCPMVTVYDSHHNPRVGCAPVAARVVAEVLWELALLLWQGRLSLLE